MSCLKWDTFNIKDKTKKKGFFLPKNVLFGFLKD